MNGHNAELSAHVFYELLAAGDELARRLDHWIEWHGRGVAADRAAVERWRAIASDEQVKCVPAD